MSGRIYKKKAAIILAALMMAMTLAGCGEMRKAQKDFDNGYYEEARELFEKMDPSPEVEEWIRKCDYQIALSMVEGKQYNEAVRALTELGSYRDSDAQLKSAKWLRMKAFVEAKGEVQNWTEGYKALGSGFQLNSLSPVVLSLYFKDAGTAVISIDGIMIDSSTTSTLTQVVNGKIEIKIDSTRAGIVYTDKGRYSRSGLQMEVTEEYTAHTDISRYTELHDILIDIFRQSGSDFLGKALRSDNPNDAYFAESFLSVQQVAIASVEGMFKSADFDFQMSDLGFTNMK